MELQTYHSQHTAPMWDFQTLSCSQSSTNPYDHSFQDACHPISVTVSKRCFSSWLSVQREVMSVTVYHQHSRIHFEELHVLIGSIYCFSFHHYAKFYISCTTRVQSNYFVHATIPVALQIILTAVLAQHNLCFHNNEKLYNFVINSVLDSS